MASPNLLRGRLSQIGACYIITAVIHQRQPLLADARIATVVIAELDVASSFEPLAWVVMPEHIHILLRLESGSLSRAVQACKSRTARVINAIRGTSGAVWQAGFYDHCIRSENELITQARYVIENPVRRGLVATVDEYPYGWCRWIQRNAL